MAQFTVTIDSTKVLEDHTDYPLYIDLADMPASFWSTVANGGGDIRVYKDDGTTELAREVVSCNTATDTGELHIKYSGTLSGSIDTVIIIDVDGSRSDYATTDTYGRNNVWSDYDLVLHMEGGNTDSTGKNTPTNVGTMTYAGTGAMGSAGEWSDAVGGYISVPNHARFQYTGNMYYSAWVQRSGVTRDSYFSKGQPWSSGSGYWLVDDDVSPANVQINRPASSFSNLTVATNPDTKTALAFVAYKKTAATNMKFFKNGSLFQTTTTNATGNFSTNSNALFIGRRTDSADLWNGVQDEVRFRTSLPSDNWVGTEYNNQNSPSTFYAIEEAVGASQNSNFLMY